jgi:hypothetical protein
MIAWDRGKRCRRGKLKSGLFKADTYQGHDTDDHPGTFQKDKSVLKMKNRGEKQSSGTYQIQELVGGGAYQPWPQALNTIGQKNKKCSRERNNLIPG